MGQPFSYDVTWSISFEWERSVSNRHLDFTPKGAAEVARQIIKDGDSLEFTVTDRAPVPRRSELS
jgi:hypothetical protein